MASGAGQVPDKLKPLGIVPFAKRAGQLEQAGKVVIAYWCQLWIVNQILAKRLHDADDDCFNFTKNLMDRLENIKKSHPDEAAIHVDSEGQRVVELFASEVFERAMRPLKGNQVTQQTASTFEAASLFLTLMSNWDAVDAEMAQKIKWAKWNAMRILKAIKNGEDPNDSNPVIEKPDHEADIDANPTSPAGSALHSPILGQPPAAIIEDARDEDVDMQDSRSSYLDPSRSPNPNIKPSNNLNSMPDLGIVSTPVSAPTSPPQPSAPAPEQVSPIAPSDQPPPDDYFPPPADTAQQFYYQSAATAPTNENVVQDQSSLVSPPPPLPLKQKNFPHASSATSPPPASYYQPSPLQAQPVVPLISPTNTLPSAPAPVPARLPNVQSQSYAAGGPSRASFNTDDASVMQAQRHCKWAISALNFEDVPTAVKEITEALRVLGAR